MILLLVVILKKYKKGTHHHNQSLINNFKQLLNVMLIFLNSEWVWFSCIYNGCAWLF